MHIIIIIIIIIIIFLSYMISIHSYGSAVGWRWTDPVELSWGSVHTGAARKFCFHWKTRGHLRVSWSTEGIPNSSRSEQNQAPEWVNRRTLEKWWLFPRPQAALFKQPTGTVATWQGCVAKNSVLSFNQCWIKSQRQSFRWSRKE